MKSSSLFLVNSLDVRLGAMLNDTVLCRGTQGASTKFRNLTLQNENIHMLIVRSILCYGYL